MVIYKITNDINGKTYVGQTTRQLGVRWKEHINDSSKGCNYPLHRAIRKYGQEHFHVMQIDVAITRDELDSKEEYWIVELNSLTPNGYNIRTGGHNSRFTDEALKKKHDALFMKPSGRSRPIRCVETGEICSYAKEFYYKYGYQHSKILECCKGRRKTHRGLHWEYV